MAIIPLPAAFSFTRVGKFGLLRATNVLRSRYTGQGQRIVYPFAIWQLEAELVDYQGPEAAAIRSFFAQLEGQKHTFRLPVPGHNRPQAGWAGNGQGVFGNSNAPLRSTSAYIGTPGPVTDGDYFQIGDELKIVVGNYAAGFNNISFRPALRKAYSHGDPVIWQNPTVLMHAAEDDVATWGLQAPVRHNLSIKAIEAVDI